MNPRSGSRRLVVGFGGLGGAGLLVGVLLLLDGGGRGGTRSGRGDRVDRGYRRSMSGGGGIAGDVVHVNVSGLGGVGSLGCPAHVSLVGLLLACHGGVGVFRKQTSRGRRNSARRERVRGRGGRGRLGVMSRSLDVPFAFLSRE